jgi:hypothetical protein
MDQHDRPPEVAPAGADAADELIRLLARVEDLEARVGPPSPEQFTRELVWHVFEAGGSF